MFKSSLLELILSTSEAKAGKSSNRAFWNSFCRLLEPRPESHQIEPPGTGFVDFWSQGQKVIKSSFLGLVLSTSGAKARKSSNRASWDWFCRLLEPRPESHQIEPPGTGFVDFWSQGQKVIKSSLDKHDGTRILDTGLKPLCSRLRGLKGAPLRIHLG